MNEGTKKSSSLKSILKEISFLAVMLFIFTTLAWQSFHIPSGSMEPTLEVGDRIFVSKYAYGYNRYSVPFDPKFISENKIFQTTPKRGDVAVFTLPYRDNIDFIKRVIGMPGDRIQMNLGRLYINGEIVKRTFIREIKYTDYRGIPRSVSEYRETLPGGVTHLIYERSDHGSLDNTGQYVVPDGHYFMMGDNRDGSSDSRVLNNVGYVSEKYIAGRADVITFSFYDCDQGKDIYCPIGVPLGRFFKSLN